MQTLHLRGDMRPTLHSQIHEWRERTEDGRVQWVRAGWDTRQWYFTVTTKGDPEWHEIEKPSLELLEALRDVLWRKYQRKRLSWKFVLELDAHIADLKGEQPVA